MKTCRNCGTVAENEQNFCQYCGSTEFVNQNGEQILPTTEPILNVEPAQTVSGQELLQKADGKVPLGVLGAFLFSILGAAVYFAIYQMGVIAGISGLIIFLLAQYGYKLFSKGNTKISITALVTSVLMMVVMIFVAEYACLAYELMKMADHLTVFEAIELVPMYFEYPDAAGEIMSDLLFAYGFGFICILGNISAILKARKTLKKQ